MPNEKKKVKTRKRKRGGNPSHKRSQISAPQPRRRPCSQPAIYGISFPQQKCNLLSNTVRRLPNRCPSRPNPLSIRSEISAGSLPERPLLIVPVRKREKKKRKCKVMKLKAPYPSIPGLGALPDAAAPKAQNPHRHSCHDQPPQKNRLHTLSAFSSLRERCSQSLLRS